MWSSRSTNRPDFRVTPVTPTARGPETSYWYWHPWRVGAGAGPDWFVRRLHAIDSDLAVTWSPIHQRWLVWVRSPKMQTKVCAGWKLLFVHHDVDHSYLPLDERVFARVYEASVFTQGSAKAYFNRIVDEMERDQARRERRNKQDTIDIATERGWDYTRIKNIGHGSKFSEFHA